jgi:large subunit ribosomal protein L19e
MELKMQRKVASRILKCGASRVWFDPVRLTDVEEAITSADIRKLINDGVIKAVPKRGVSSARKQKMRMQKRKGRRKGIGSRKGKKSARFNKKKAWINKIRSQRKLLKEWRASGRIEKKTFRKLYRMCKAGFFRNRSHLTSYVEKEGLLLQMPEKK